MFVIAIKMSSELSCFLSAAILIEKVVNTFNSLPRTDHAGILFQIL